MAQVMIVCPVTERRVPLGIEVEAGPAYRRHVPTSGTLRCVACHRVHSWYRAETVLEGTPGRQRIIERPARSTTTDVRYIMRRVDLAAR